MFSNSLGKGPWVNPANSSSVYCYGYLWLVYSLRSVNFLDPLIVKSFDKCFNSSQKHSWWKIRNNLDGKATLKCLQRIYFPKHWFKVIDPTSLSSNALFLYNHSLFVGKLYTYNIILPGRSKQEVSSMRSLRMYDSTREEYGSHFSNCVLSCSLEWT